MVEFQQTEASNWVAACPMFGDGSLTFREFAMRERVPLATVQDAVLQFLRGRDDAALFGARAVNAYVDQPRMTQVFEVARSGIRQNSGRCRRSRAGRWGPNSGEFGYFRAKRATSKTQVVGW
jgi:hypothetical protein